MNIKLKKIKIYHELSEGSTAFLADLYIDDVKAAIAKNDGFGMPTRFIPYSIARARFVRDADEYCRGLPPVVDETLEIAGKPIVIPMNLGQYVSRHIEAYLLLNKAKKEMYANIVYGIPDRSFKTLSLKDPVNRLLKKQEGTAFLKHLLHDVLRPDMKPGEVILNTNIPDELLAGMPRMQESMFPAIAQSINHAADRTARKQSRSGRNKRS